MRYGVHTLNDIEQITLDRIELRKGRGSLAYESFRNAVAAKNAFLQMLKDYPDECLDSDPNIAIVLNTDEDKDIMPYALRFGDDVSHWTVDAFYDCLYVAIDDSSHNFAFHHKPRDLVPNGQVIRRWPSALKPRMAG